MTEQCIIALDVSGKAISAQSEQAAITFYAFLMALFAPADTGWVIVSERSFAEEERTR